MGKQKLSEYEIEGLYGFGGTDQDGEWYSSGPGGYTYIQNTVLDCKHNYSVYFRRNCLETGFLAYIYLCINACNSDNFLLGYTKFYSLKECKWYAMEFIKDFEQSNRFDKIIVPYIKEMYRPVFSYIDDVLCLIGYTALGVGNDLNDQCGANSRIQFSYFKENTPEFYSIKSREFYEESEYGVCKIQINSGSRSSGGISGDELTKVKTDIGVLREKYNLPEFKKRITRFDLTRQDKYW